MNTETARLTWPKSGIGLIFRVFWWTFNQGVRNGDRMKALDMYSNFTDFTVMMIFGQLYSNNTDFEGRCKGLVNLASPVISA